jgi:peptidoglycan/LPS O-acetylase OafA/YrhL
MMVGHGYLAVDFFFALSGFVIGYAYDDRWSRGMSVGAFLKRRVVRLHPMVAIGMILGACLFYFGASPEFSLIAGTPLWRLLLYLFLGMLMIPTPPSVDIRGWQETYTLDAPCWSLFFEYAGNVLYALFVRRFALRVLAVAVGISAVATMWLTLTNGSVSGGWVLSPEHLGIGFVRLLYPFLAGLLLYRLGLRPQNLRLSFLWCSLILIIVLMVPSPMGFVHTWQNGLYEGAVILLIFPAIVYMGAGSVAQSRRLSRICKFMGDISYPVYLVNYPIMYVFTGWISRTGYTLEETWWMTIVVFVATIAVSYVLMRWCEGPLRAWLGRKLRL